VKPSQARHGEGTFGIVLAMKMAPQFEAGVMEFWNGGVPVFFDCSRRGLRGSRLNVLSACIGALINLTQAIVSSRAP
jgi:hypothetical protein